MFPRLSEYVLNMFLFFGKIPISTECPPKVSIFHDEITIVGYFVNLTFCNLYRWMKIKIKRKGDSDSLPHYELPWWQDV